MAEQKSRSMLLDLPKELRQKIYRHLVVAETSITFLMRTRRGVKFLQLGIPLVYRLDLTLMRVNHEVSYDAFEAFLHDNMFEAYSAKCLRLFMQRYANHKQHMRHMVIIYVRSRSPMRSALHQLKDATYLRSLTLNHYVVYRRSVEKLAEDCRPWFIALAGSYKKKNVSGSVLDVLRIAHSFEYELLEKEGIRYEFMESEEKLLNAYSSGLRSKLAGFI